jgi:hypothetical protein
VIFKYGAPNHAGILLANKSQHCAKRGRVGIRMRRPLQAKQRDSSVREVRRLRCEAITYPLPEFTGIIGDDGNTTAPPQEHVSCRSVVPT